jgi:hypothetical protein
MSLDDAHQPPLDYIFTLSGNFVFKGGVALSHRFDMTTRSQDTLISNREQAYPDRFYYWLEALSRNCPLALLYPAVRPVYADEAESANNWRNDSEINRCIAAASRLLSQRRPHVAIVSCSKSNCHFVYYPANALTATATSNRSWQMDDENRSVWLQLHPRSARVARNTFLDFHPTRLLKRSLGISKFGLVNTMLFNEKDIRRLVPIWHWSGLQHRLSGRAANR